MQQPPSQDARPSDLQRLATALRDAPLLRDLGEPHLIEIARMGRVHRYGAGAIVFNEADRGDTLHLILEGAVRVVRIARSGDEVLLARLGPGDVLGELALLDGGARSATAIVAEPSVHVVVDRAPFQSWLEREPHAALALLRTLVKRLRLTDEIYADLALLPLAQRLAKLLLRLVLEERSNVLRATQADLGERLGVTRESVNKCLRSLEDRGVIKLGRGRCEVVALERLRAIADGA